MTKTIPYNKLKSHKNTPPRLTNLIVQQGTGQLEGDQVFVSLFSKLPSEITLPRDKYSKAKILKRLIDDEYEIITLDSDFTGKTLTLESGMFKVREMIIHVSGWANTKIYYSPEDIKKTLEFIDTLSNLKVERKKPSPKGKIYSLTIIGSGKNQRVGFSPFKLTALKMSIKDNYSDEFYPVHQHLTKTLKDDNENGIAILHGEAGTGKTYYLRYLCKNLNKKILYIPPAMVGYLMQPDFMKVLAKHKNSILIIEDADNILRKRDDMQDNQSVSTLLNLADGMLQDILKLKIVATFNTDLKNIDDAFMRSGRLIAEYKFTKLPAEKAQALSNKLGFETTITDPMSLTDVYNQNYPKFKIQEPVKQVGFK